jgi:hypothetical protein
VISPQISQIAAKLKTSKAANQPEERESFSSLIRVRSRKFAARFFADLRLSAQICG